MGKSVPVLEDLPSVEGTSVLVRTDFNVPMSGGRITDDLRIRLSLETLTWLLDQGAAEVTTASHLGRPKGRPDPAYRHGTGPPAPRGAADRHRRRRHPGQAAAEPPLRSPGGGRRPGVRRASWWRARTCSSTRRFGAAHRAHASVVGPPRWLPSAGGRALVREVEVLGGLLHGAARPFVAVLGGSKVSDKLGVIEALLDRVDTLLVGGGMCFTFLAAQGHPIGESLFEADQVDDCRRLLAIRPDR